MCETCGCAITDKTSKAGIAARDRMQPHAIEVLEGLLSENDHAAGHNRTHFGRHGVLALNLMSAPGSGKTALLEATIKAVGARFKMAVIEGDLATENDAERIRRHGVTAIQISTGSACHLDAHMVHDALHELDLEGVDILFIENVGNLVCPASFDLGQHANVTLVSVPEGDDKPAKYPVMFRAADLVLLSKADLLQYLPDFNPQRATDAVRALGSTAAVLQLSASSGEGLQAWVAWLQAQLERVRGAGDAPLPRAGHSQHGHGADEDRVPAHDHPHQSAAGRTHVHHS